MLGSQHTYLCIVDPDGAVHDVPLHAGEMTIGRDPSNQIVLVGRGVSRRHARLFCTPEDVTLEDLGSRYGTRVNGDLMGGEIQLPGGNAMRTLRTGDVIAIGVFSLELRAIDVASTVRVRMISTEPASTRTISNVDSSGLRKAVEQALAHDALAGDQRTAIRALEILYRASELTASTQSLDALLDRVLDLALAETSAGVAVALLWNEEGALVPRASRRSSDTDESEIQVSRTVVDRVASERLPIAAEVALDPTLAASESMVGMGVRSVAATPLMAGEEMHGVLYLHRTEGVFDAASVDVLSVLGRLIGSGIERARGRALERFHPLEVAAELARKSANALGGDVGTEARATVLAIELANFGGLSERVPARRLVRLLSSYYDLVHTAVMASGGTLVSFADGRALALYGMPRSTGKDAAQAAQAALTLREKFSAWIGTRDPGARTAVRMALDTGPILAGPIGPAQHLTYAALGPSVTTSKALALRAPDTTILLTERTYSELDPAVFHVLTVDRAYGSGEVVIYELVSRTDG